MTITHCFPKVAKCALGIFAAAILVSPLAQAFEGQIDMTVTAKKKKESMAMTYYFKDTLIRAELTPADAKPGQTPPTILINAETKESTILMAEQKKYMVMSMKDNKAMEEASEKAVGEFAPTGRTETIAGIKAEEFVSSKEGKKTEIWVTKELGQFMMANNKGGSKGSAWEVFAKQGNFFPLRTITYAKDGKTEEFHLETTKVDKRKLESSLFVPPADYQKFEIPSMGDMMKGMIPGNR